MSLQSIVTYFRRMERPLQALTIENIHSYEVSPEFRIPNQSDYLVLISASTSGGLARKLVDEKQADPMRIVHLLGVAAPAAEFRKSCLYFRERNASDRQSAGRGQANAVIEIATEEFLVAQGPPRPVRITKRHVNQHGANQLHMAYLPACPEIQRTRSSSRWKFFILLNHPRVRRRLSGRRLGANQFGSSASSVGPHASSHR